MATEHDAAIQRAVSEALAAGADPNDLLEAFEETVDANDLWARWGDGRWRPNLVCSICGSPYMGICGPGDSFDSPTLHRNNPEQQQIPMREWIGAHPPTPARAASGGTATGGVGGGA